MNNISENKTTANKLSQQPKKFLISLPIDKIKKLYLEGMSVNKLSKKFNVSRRCIDSRLISVGIIPRTPSEAQRIKWTFMDETARRNQTRAANKATLGRTVSWETKCKHAKTTEKKPNNVSKYEIQLKKMLFDRGIKTISQKAIGAYNCDLAANPIAVEVFGGKWHWYGEHLSIIEERFRYILNSGWFIYVVPVYDPFPLTDAVADYLVSYIKSIRSNKPSVTSYRVVWGAGEFITKGSCNDEHISIIPPFTKTRDLTTGRYKRVRV